MESDQKYLFKDKRFLPLFLVQFFGSFNDNILKSALIILINFKLINSLSISTEFLILLANIIFISPFVIFASIAGQVADRFERAKIVRFLKLFEVFIVLLSAYGFQNENLYILYVSLGFLGIHSTFFGPIKYSSLPDQLEKTELLAANGFIEAGTFLSILFGTIIGGFYNQYYNLVLGIAIIASMVGFTSSLFMPNSKNTNPDIKINLNIWAETIAMVRYATSKTQVYLAILGISWFWFIAVVIMAQIPTLTRKTFGADENVTNLFLATFSIGVGVGSFWCNKIFNNKITTKYVFLAALGMSLFILDLFFASRIASINYEPEHLKSVADFLSRWHYKRILGDLFFIAAIGGIYVVPLFALMQSMTTKAHMSRVIAVNNLINSFFMCASTVILSLLYFAGLTIPNILLFISVVNFIVALHIYHLIPDSVIVPLKLWRAFFKFMFERFYTIEVKGLENYKKAGEKTVIVANHLSYIDPPLIASYIPEDIQFAVNMETSKLWWVKPFLKLTKTYAIDPTNPMAIKSLIGEVKKGNKIAIFPEGRTSVTGSLMKVYEGPGMIADRAGASILPIRVDGTQFTIFSKVRKLMRGRFQFKRKITITILPPVKMNIPEGIDNRVRRKFISHRLYDVMSEMMFESSNYKNTLFQSIISSSKIYGSKNNIFEDSQGNSASFREAITKAFVLANLVKKHTSPGEYVGLMLPTAVGTMISFMGLQASGRVVAMINFTAGINNVISCCKTAQLKTIYTSKVFVRKAELEELINSLKNEKFRIIYLEDLRSEVTLGMKIKSYIASYFSDSYYQSICSNRNPEDPSVILFTSGSEGVPKAVALSHQNILANAFQVQAKIDFNPNDCSFNALPMFHTFGLTASIIMCLNGVKIFFYPTPLHYRIIPELIYDIGATILFGTDTFLSGYASYAHPYDFYSLRYVVSGAEKLKPKTRSLWSEKFGIRIFEGYGVTETSPVIAVNTPMHEKASTVGRLVPNIQARIKEVDGLSEGGRLCVKGPNIMLGYITSKNPGIIEPVKDELYGEGWHDTGDIVTIDDENYITITGRFKRFAKIAGEMVSFSVIEDIILSIDKGAIAAAAFIGDDKKGEQIILYYVSDKEITREIFAKECKEKGFPELYIPRKIIRKSGLPLLASGKLSYGEIDKMALDDKNKEKES